MKTVTSIRKISEEDIYPTGDSPFLMDCSDGRQWVCKYSRTLGSSSNKLICELIGAIMLDYWEIESPEHGFVTIKSEHVPYNMSNSWFNTPCYGTVLIDNTHDINFNNVYQIEKNAKTLNELLRIALYDFWVSNEDRSANNTNLIYNYETNTIIPIDNGGIFNTINIDYQISILDPSESILSADIYKHLKTEKSKEAAIDLKKYYLNCIDKCLKNKDRILKSIPNEWNPNNTKISSKLDELFDKTWIDSVWKQFINTINQ